MGVGGLFLKKKTWSTLVKAKNLVNIGASNGLLPNGTKPLPEPMLTNHISEVLWHSPGGNYMCKKVIYPSFKIANLRLYSETCIKWPLNFVVSQDRWSPITGRINMILWRLCQTNAEIYVFLVRLSWSHYTGSTATVSCRGQWVSHTWYKRGLNSIISCHFRLALAPSWCSFCLPTQMACPLRMLPGFVTGCGTLPQTSVSPRPCWRDCSSVLLASATRFILTTFVR